MMFLVDLLSQSADSLSRPLVTHQATSPTLFSPYAAHMLFYAVIIAFLVVLVLVGSFLVVNFGMMSKREDDRVGGRTPSDVGILQDQIWPQKSVQKWALPAVPDPEEVKADTQEGEEPSGPTKAA